MVEIHRQKVGWWGASSILEHFFQSGLGAGIE
jgi:hypothetical protein